MTGRVVTSRYSMPDGQKPPAPDDLMIGPRDHWRVVSVEPIDSTIWVNSWRIRQEQLGPHHGAFDHYVNGSRLEGALDVQVWFSIPLLRGERPPELLLP